MLHVRHFILCCKCTLSCFHCLCLLNIHITEYKKNAYKIFLLLSIFVRLPTQVHPFKLSVHDLVKYSYNIHANFKSPMTYFHDRTCIFSIYLSGAGQAWDGNETQMTETSRSEYNSENVYIIKAYRR